MGAPGGYASPAAPATLLGVLTTAVRDALANADHATLLFSGGLDSALLAWLAPASVPLTLVTVGTPGAPDLAAARDAAQQMGREVEVHVLTPAEILDAWDRGRDELHGLREPIRSVALAFALATEAARPGRVLCGQGADELFYGYAHLQGLSPEAARQRARDDLDRLVGTDWPRALRMGDARGRALSAPYLDPRVREIAARFAPPAFGEPPKIALRRAAAVAGLPPALVDRPKRALQYGSGVAKVLARSRPEEPPRTG